jgi:hypothetical protein
MPEPIAITAPSANLIPVDPTARMNTIAMVQLANKIIAEHRAGDLKIDQKFSTAVSGINAAIDALTEQVRIDPKKIEAKLRELLNDPAVAATLVGSIARVPGMDVSIGSAIKAYIEEPKVTEFHMHTDPVTGLMTGVTATVQSGSTVTQSVFVGTSAEYDNDNDGLVDEIVTTLATDNFAGVPASFKVFIAKRNEVVTPAVGQAGTPGFIEAFTLPSYSKTGQSAVVIDLSPRFQASVQSEPPALIDIDGDGLEGFSLPAPVRAALVDLQGKIAQRAAAVAAAAAADSELAAAQAAASDAEAALAAAAAAVESAALSAQANVNSAQVRLDNASTVLTNARNGVYVAQQAVQLADNVSVLDLSVSDWQSQVDQAVAEGEAQSVVDGLQASLSAAIAARDAAVTALAAATNDQTIAETALAAAQDEVNAATQVKAQADAALSAVMAPLTPLQTAADDAAADLVAATGLQEEKREAVDAATTLAQAALVTFNALKVEHGIGADYGLPTYTV